MAITQEDVVGFMPRSLEDGEPIKLAMQELWLTGKLLPVGARLVVRHVFESAERKPVEVVYSFGLPRDAAMRKFRVESEGAVVHSELRPVKEAEEAYEEAMESGHLATMATAYGDGLVNLNVGNIRPGEPVVVHLEIAAGVEPHDGGFRFRFPFTLAPSYHRKARPIEVAPGEGEIDLPSEEFGDTILPKWVASAKKLHGVGFDLSVDMDAEIAEVSSPSHGVSVRMDGTAGAQVSLARARDVPNRDLVLDVSTKEVAPRVLGGVDAEGKARFAAVIPSAVFGESTDAPRNLVFLVDRSGSMGGEPMEQARNAVLACLGALSEGDRFGIVAFDTHVESFKRATTSGTARAREQASKWLRSVDARGGTELAQGIEAAAKAFKGKQGEILVLTDGQVFGGEEVLALARSHGVRLHCLGIGSASQDRFLALLARETGGTSRFVTPRERVDMAALELFASIGRPVASDLEFSINGLDSATIAPEPGEDAYGGTPVVVFGNGEAADGGALEVRWTHEGEKQSTTIPLEMEGAELGETVKLLQGARLITDFESRHFGDEEDRPAGRRRQRRVEAMLKKLSEEYGLASRAMALVAVMERRGARAGVLPETQIVPVGMPEDVEFGSYFGRLASPVMGAALSASVFRHAMPAMAEDSEPFDVVCEAPPSQPSGPSPEDSLVALAAAIQPDGGMEGDDIEARVAASLAALLAFYEHDNTEDRGPFSPHVKRLLGFIEAHIDELEGEHGDVARRAIEMVRDGREVPGEWLELVVGCVLMEGVSADDAWRMLASVNSEEN